MRLCVFCGSGIGNAGAFLEEVRAVVSSWLTRESVLSIEAFVEGGKR